MASYFITSCYRFLALTDIQVASLKVELEKFAQDTGLRGLCLIGEEGVNLTVSAGTEKQRADFKLLLKCQLGVNDLQFKDSLNERHPFQYFKVKVKEEIVTLGRPDLRPSEPANCHLSPQDWNKALQDPETIVIDTRNDYEVEIGKFKSAIDFGIKEFGEFPAALEKSEIDKSKNILIYCTGGIRCEKAILAMHEQGFSKVHQLGGGILSYLEQFPEQEFEGECFVFDYRVAVDQALKPTKTFRPCPHCGQPAKAPIRCTQCKTEAQLCSTCTQSGVETCSKNCAHHQAIGSNSSKPHRPELMKRHLTID